MRLSLLLGEVTGRAMVLNGESKELEVESIVSGALCRNRGKFRFNRITTIKIKFVMLFDEKKDVLK